MNRAAGPTPTPDEGRRPIVPFDSGRHDDRRHLVCVSNRIVPFALLWFVLPLRR